MTDPARPYAERRAALAQLRQGFSADEKQALCFYLATPAPDDETQAAQVLKNSVMDLLIAQAAPLPDLAGRLAALSRDPSLHVVIRDYAVQHLVAFYPQLDHAPAEVAQASRAVLREALFQALDETDNSMAGTALLGLSRLSGQYPDFDTERIRLAAAGLASDPRVGELARITSLQVCAQMGLAGVLPVCLSLANQSSNTPLRLSAIAAVGQLGGPSELPLLTRILSENDERLHPAARLALSRLQARADGAAPAHTVNH